MPTPKKAVPYLTVGFGTKPKLLKLPPGMVQPPTAAKKAKPVATPYAGVQVPTTKAVPVGEAPAGRPPSNLGKYLIKPTNRGDTGFEMLNTTPDLIDQVNQQYLRKGELPMALQPKYLRKPEVLDNPRKKSISRGWRKPRSQQG